MSRRFLTCLAEGLSNREIANQLYLTERTVRWYNSQIYSKLGVHNRSSAVKQATALDLLTTEAEAASDTQVRHNLPRQTSAFVGREEEIEELLSLLAIKDTALVTILAPGGMGKTRLALAVAEQQLRHFSDGVFFVPLAPLTSLDDIVTSIAQSVGFSFDGSEAPKQQLLDYFRDRHALLLLDNFEHLLDGSPLVTDLLQAAPQVKIMATSREKLNLSGEIIFSLSGMHFPSRETPEDALDYDAVKLFMQSAQRVRPDFELQAEDLDNLARICRLTAGMPLGIVLAAGWVDVMMLDQIAAEVQQGIDILETEARDVPERQRSVRSTFNYTWARLDQSERDVFMKLSVFRGGFTVEAAQAVAGATMYHLRKLVDRALVQALPTGRYDIHELLRQFGSEQLAATDTNNPMRDAHGAYYLRFLHQHQADVKGRRQLAGLNEIAAEFENIRAAWYWAVEQKQYDLIDSSMECLTLFCEMRGHYIAGKTLLKSAREAMAPHIGDNPTALWGRMLVWELMYHTSRTSYEEVTQAEQGLAIARQFGTLQDEAFGLLVLAEMIVYASNFDEAKSYAEQGLELYRTLDDKYYIATALRLLALYYHRAGRRDKSIPLWKQSRDLARETGNKLEVSFALMHLGIDTRYETGDYHEAERYWQDAYNVRRDIDQPAGVAVTGSALSEAAIVRGDRERARALANELLEFYGKISGGWNELVGFPLRTLAVLALADENYDEAWRLLNESRETDRVEPLSKTDLRLAMVCCGLQDFQSARRYLRVGLESIEANCAPPFLTNVLPPAALLLAHDGKIEQATQLLGLALTYPRTHVGMMAAWPLIELLVADLKAKLGPELYHIAWERGQAYELVGLVTELLAEFRDV